MQRKKNEKNAKPDRSFMKSTTIERDPALTSAYTALAAAGAFIVAACALLLGARAALGAGLGGLLAASNLWVIEKLVSAYLKAGGGRWAAIATVKAGVLLSVVAVLVKGGLVDVVPVVAGFGALPVGVVVAGLFPKPPAREEV